MHTQPDEDDDLKRVPPFKVLVNIGCGAVYHRDWLNLDFAPVAAEVRQFDLRSGVPFASGTVDAIYHSHVLEHLDRDTGRRFVGECARVLRPGGILRIAVPDLEGIARAYLAVIDDRAGLDRVMHNWLRIELTDQFSRTRSGGAVVDFLRGLSAEELARVRRRIGFEIDNIASRTRAADRSLLQRMRSAGIRRLVARGRLAVARACVRILAGADATRAFDEGIFRGSGEVHRLAFDRHSLALELEACGFAAITRMDAGVSRIPDFARYGLEIVAGEIRKPDSLFMEAERS